jgi:hypothetical protein
MLSQFLQRVVVGGCLLLISTSAYATSQEASPGLLLQQTNGWQIPYNPIDITQSADGTSIFILTESSQVLIYEPNGTLKGSFPVDPGVTAIDTDVRGENIFLVDREKKTLRKISVDFVSEIDITGSPFKGKADAPVTIAVFSDFE